MTFLEEFQMLTDHVDDIRDVEPANISNPDGIVTREEMVEIMVDVIGSMGEIMHFASQQHQVSQHNLMQVLKILEKQDLIHFEDLDMKEFDA